MRRSTTHSAAPRLVARIAVARAPMADPPQRHAARGAAGTAGTAESVPQGDVRGLPITPLLTYPPEDGVHYVVTAVDARGRLADASPIRALGWTPGSQITLHVLAGAVIIATPANPPHNPPGTAGPPSSIGQAGRTRARTARPAITAQGHLRLPATIRHGCRLQPGSRLLVAAHRRTGVLAAFTTRVLDGVLRTYYLSLTNHGDPGDPGPRPRSEARTRTRTRQGGDRG